MHLLIPDLLLPRAHAREVLADLPLPGLARLLAQTRETRREEKQAALQRSLPATRWLLDAFGHAADLDCAPIVQALRAADGLDGLAAHWHVVQPCHFAVARDHVQLGIDRLALRPDEAQALLASARPLLDEDGIAVEVGPSGRWYWRDPQFDALLCAEPARAIGRNVDLWLPDVAPGADPAPARRWRRLLNEVQMLWFDHPVNRAREAEAAPPVNALWLYGGGPLVAAATRPEAGARAAAAAIAPADAAMNAARPRDAVGANTAQAVLRGLALLAARPLVARDPAAEALVLLDDLAGPAARNDWASWRDALLALERDWFAPLAQAGRTPTLTVCSEADWRTRTARTGPRWQFWKRPSLVEALSA